MVAVVVDHSSSWFSIGMKDGMRVGIDGQRPGKAGSVSRVGRDGKQDLSQYGIPFLTSLHTSYLSDIPDKV